MTAIGTINKDFHAPPDWATPGGHSRDHLFSFFETRKGGQWAFLAAGHEIRLAGSKYNWKTDLVVEPKWGEISKNEILDLIVKTPKIFKLEMDENERLWLAAALKSAADLFSTIAMARDQAQ